MKKLKPFLIILLLIAIGFATYYTFFATSSAQQVHYITEPVKVGNLDKSVLATGSVRAIQRTEVGAQVSGKIQKLHVQLGQAVKKSQ